QDVRKEDALLLGSAGKKLDQAISGMMSREFKKRSQNKANYAKELGLGGLGKAQRTCVVEAVQRGLPVLW
ncbi:unnamed protein product, partial [Ectocarpus sp. 4 AP-2014]